MDIISILLLKIEGLKILGLIADILGVLGITGVLGYLISYISWRRNQMSKLGEIADKEKIKLIKSKKYIPTMGQYEPPHDGENAFISSERFSLLDKMLKDLGSTDYSSKKRYIIMGGSGMGKSTFLAALLYKYINKRLLRKSPFPIYVKSLGNPRVIDQIREIKDDNVYRSVLLLDALDENIHASSDLIQFMNELEGETNEFSTVIITCRTQFYEDAESEPHVWSIPNSGASKDRVIKYNRIYISPFTDQEVDTFLNERYGDSVENYAKARIIANQSTDVMLRPMILSFMDDLLDLNDIDSIKTVEIYYKIIDKWFERECEIKNIEKLKLLSFSKKLAVYMYNQWLMSQDLYLSVFQYNQFVGDNGFVDDPYSYKERSLINRTSKGDIKFSHRSFWEFFLAIDAFERPGKRYNATGLDMAQKFHNEIYELFNNSRYLDCINYYDYSFSLNRNFSDIIVARKIKEIKKYYRTSIKSRKSDKEKLEQPLCLIYELWVMLLQRLFNQYSIIHSLTKLHRTEIGLFKNEDYYVDRISLLLGKILDFFEFPKNSIFKDNYLPTITDIYEEICSLNNDIKMTTTTKERFILPNYIENEPQDIGHFDLIHIGNGFCQTKDLQKAIDYLLGCKPTPLLFLYVDVQSLKELIDFIILIKASNNKRCIIVRALFDSTTELEYVVVDSYLSNKITLFDANNQDKERIKITTTLQNMFKAKLLLEHN